MSPSAGTATDREARVCLWESSQGTGIASLHLALGFQSSEMLSSLDGARQMVAKLYCSPWLRRRPRLAGSSVQSSPVPAAKTAPKSTSCTSFWKGKRCLCSVSPRSASPVSLGAPAGPRKEAHGAEPGLMAPAAAGQPGVPWRGHSGGLDDSSSSPLNLARADLQLNS